MAKDLAGVKGLRSRDNVDIKGRVECGEMRDEFRLFRKDIGAEVDPRTMMSEGKWSDLHIDLGKLEANCRFREVLWKVCEGGLDPSMGVYAILACAASCPEYLVMDGTRINLYVVLLAGVGTGKDTVIDRAIQAFWPSGRGPYSYAAPGGDKQVALLLGPTYGEKRKVVDPAPRHLLLVTPELGDMLSKAGAEASSLMQTMCWLKDKPKTFLDARTHERAVVDCVPSWLAALPVGTPDGGIDPEKFMEAFGKQSSDGLTSRTIYGFSEFRFDRRKARHWKAPETWHWESTFSMADGEAAELVAAPEPLGVTLSKARVEGWESSELEKEFEEWDPGPNLSGRDTHHIQQAAIIIALANGHKLVTRADWRFAKEIMRHQNAIRKVFSASRAENNPHARFNETAMRIFERQTEKALAKGKKKRDCWLLWRKYSGNNRWPDRFGIDVEKAIDALVRGGRLVYRTEEGEDGKEKADKKYVMLATLHAEIMKELDERYAPFGKP